MCLLLDPHSPHLFDLCFSVRCSFMCKTALPMNTSVWRKQPAFYNNKKTNISLGTVVLPILLIHLNVYHKRLPPCNFLNINSLLKLIKRYSEKMYKVKNKIHKPGIVVIHLKSFSEIMSPPPLHSNPIGDSGSLLSTSVATETKRRLLMVKLPSSCAARIWLSCRIMWKR